MTTPQSPDRLAAENEALRALEAERQWVSIMEDREPNEREVIWLLNVERLVTQPVQSDLAPATPEPAK